MISSAMSTTPDTKLKRNPRGERLSPDGKWRSFPKVPNLLQYVSTGLYFARMKVQGKPIRRSLKAATFEEAKLALHDFIKKHHEPETGLGTFGQALKKYLRALNLTHDLSEQSKRYRRYCVKALLASWPGLRFVQVRKITEQQCREWASRFSAEKDEQYFNNTLSVLRGIIECGGISKDGNPARKIKRLGVKQTELHLPEPEQFNKILEIVRTSGAGQAHHCADLIRFLAFSGCRISEARKVTWADVDLGRGEMRVWNAKRSKRSNAATTRQVPIIPPMRELLTRLRKSDPPATARVCVLGECEKSLSRACRLVQTFRITHHDLRHLFATRCIEAGVDIPTVSRWLGHSDGGALAMKTYGHLRREHSAAMAQRVTFDSAPASKVVALPKEVAA
jgi:integrase